MSVSQLISRLPDLPAVLDRCRAMAMLDAVLSPIWANRYYSCDSRWAPGEVMASMRDGYGNAYRIVFSAGGAFATGFDHESALSPYLQFPEQAWPGLFDGVPEAFQAQLAEPAFCDEDGVPEATTCFWREATDSTWRTGNPAPDPDGHEDDGGAAWLFDVLLDGSPEAYRSFAEKYYEADVDLDAVRHVYALRPLTQEVVHALNPQLELAALAGDVAEIGYPSGS
ncbi:hypothetical protein OU787_01065 [Kitasatospora sp. YST-16]|uniref:hypothetical protein n=1 Tax=Kitasatospora sp. YST-16 TaxID=2998080 RepID=UPI00228390DF|nr:hypothetical protein [Kitasatospora sp. YST-16]WAL70202.1 hypothetical protein OU787_01065 [Kitasatospora sp. YST-16]WNW36243.1 hypothetical protein RKE32_01075 [Streptomyces sp. Li-HN-5-13]